LFWLNDSDPNDGISFCIPSIYIQEVLALEGVALVLVAVLFVAALLVAPVAALLLLLVFVLVLVLLLMLLAVVLVTVSTCSLDDNDLDRDTNCNTDVIGVGILELLVDGGNDDGSGNVFIPFFISTRAVSDCATTPSIFFLKAVNFLFNATRSSAIGGSA